MKWQRSQSKTQSPSIVGSSIPAVGEVCEKSCNSENQAYRGDSTKRLAAQTKTIELKLEKSLRINYWSQASHYDFALRATQLFRISHLLRKINGMPPNVWALSCRPADRVARSAGLNAKCTMDRLEGAVAGQLQCLVRQRPTPAQIHAYMLLDAGGWWALTQDQSTSAQEWPLDSKTRTYQRCSCEEIATIPGDDQNLYRSALWGQTR